MTASVPRGVEALRNALAAVEAELARLRDHDKWATDERSYFYTQMFVERDRAERAERVVARVEALHHRKDWYSTDGVTPGCAACDLAETWPCPTIVALSETEATS